MTLQNIVGNITNILNFYVIPLIVTLALIYFLWGVSMLIFNASSEEKKNEGKSIMIWGIIALFVMVSVWGLVNVLQGTFLKNVNTTNPPIPQFGL